VTLSEAADILFGVLAGPTPDFFDYKEGSPQRRDIIARQLSVAAGGAIGKMLYVAVDRDVTGAAMIWAIGDIADCLLEAQRIADTARFTQP